VIDISLLTITSKHLTGCEVLLRYSATGSLWNGLHCWTVDWAAKSTAVEPLTEFWVNFHSMKTNISDLFGSQQKLLLFPTTYFCEAGVSTLYLILEPSTETNFNQKTTSGECWRPQTIISTKLWNKLKNMILIGICECGWSTKSAKANICIILVLLIYLESMKINTGPKIVRVLKRLGKTGVD